ncbi:MAG: hypothetical protein ACFFAH_14935 [Promethearchaeota archaeon]
MPKYVKCEYCGEKVDKRYVTYVQGRPYCENCVNEAEIYADAEVLDEDDDEDDEDEDDDYDDYVDD